jgi:hypothetical protein
MTIMKTKVMFFFPLVTTHDIKKFIPLDSRFPIVTDNSTGRTGVNALSALSAMVIRQWLRTI